MKTIYFDPNGDPLWVRITTTGWHPVSFTYELLEKEDLPIPSRTLLTEPAIAGNNLDKQSVHYLPVVNAFQPGEPLEVYDGRFIHTTFLIMKLQDETGSNIQVDLLQGQDHAQTVHLGGDTLHAQKFSRDRRGSITRGSIKFKIAQKQGRA